MKEKQSKEKVVGIEYNIPQRSTFLIKEMEHRDALSKNKLFSYLAVRETQLKNLSFLLAVVINMLVIGSYGATPSVRGGTVGDVQVSLSFHCALLIGISIHYNVRWIVGQQ